MNRTRIGGALLAVALPFAFTGVAGASAPTSITLTVGAPERGGATVELECHPPGGSHPNAWSACVALHRAHGDFDALADQQEPASCTMEYRPVVAQAHGTWRGKPVEWTREFGNDCTLETATGSVFRF
ncbi:SSI family serine proteinase inhibitor [Actinophytocola sp. NPDC049390]|uniref:SSI family serine proteinase inhibitor n=1 Tax=Actinophytocola sp. NPDC049390 TaxID=3363894 RepID=UPI0037A23595